jgi:hypothetical protein
VLLGKQEASFTKALELMTLRRIHALDADHISQIIKSYSLLVEQDKLGSPTSVTFVQAFEQKISGNHQVFQQNLNSLVMASVALFKLFRLSRLPGSAAPVVTKQALLESFEHVLFEMKAEQEEGEDSETTIESTQLAQLYAESFFMRFA